MAKHTKHFVPMTPDQRPLLQVGAVLEIWFDGEDPKLRQSVRRYFKAIVADRFANQIDLIIEGMGPFTQHIDNLIDCEKIRLIHRSVWDVINAQENTK